MIIIFTLSTMTAVSEIIGVKMTVIKLGWLGGVALAFTLSNACSHVESEPDSGPVVMTAVEKQATPLAVPQADFLRIEQMKVGFWWWEESVAAGMDGENPPKKTRYLDLERWEYDGEGLKTYPHNVDIAISVKNETAKPVDAKIELSLSARFEDYDRRSYTDQDNACKGRPWERERTVVEKQLRIDSNGVKLIEKQEYDLTKLLNEKVDGRSICAVRFRVEILDLQGNIRLKKEKIVPVLLGD